MKISWVIFITLCCLVGMSSCSKEESEIPLANPGVSSDDFDTGYLGIRLEGNNSMVDSIVYTNTTRGFSFNLNPEEIIFIDQVGKVDTGALSKSLYNAKRGDVVNCCVYMNSSSLLGITYIDTIVHLDTVQTGKICVNGTY